MIYYDPRQILGTVQERRRLFAKLWGAFPNHASTKASYDYMTQSIELAKVNRRRWEAYRGGSMTDTLDIVPVLMHELTHWWDHIGTSWGANLIRKQFAAISALRSNDETQLQEILPMSREIHSSQVPTYFTYYSDNWLEVPSGERWGAEITLGYRFDNLGRIDMTRPMPFTRFVSPSTREHCRFPFTALMLLETRAIHAELFSEFALASMMDEDASVVRRIEIDRKFTEMLYDPLMVEYLGCVHYTANTFRITEAFEAFALSSAVAGVALNLLPSHFKLLRTPQLFDRWEEQIGALTRSADRGYAFLALLQNAKELEAGRGVDAILEASGLPTARVLGREVLGGLSTDPLITTDSDLFAEFTNLLSSGRYVMNHWNPERQIAEGNPHMPLVLLSDGEMVLSGHDPFNYSVDQHEVRLDRLTRESRSMFEFQQACALA